MSLIDDVTVIEGDHEWHVRYKENEYFHPSPTECGNLKKFIENHNGFYLGFGPFCHLTGYDISGKDKQGLLERIKQKSGCSECIQTFIEYENAKGVGFIFIKKIKNNISINSKF